MESPIYKLIYTTFLFVLLLLPQEIYSQLKPIRIGIRGGWNYSFTNVEIIGLNVKGRNGTNLGGVFEYWVSDLFAIHTNVLYNMKGNKWDREFIYGTAEYTWEFNYLSIPILAKFAFGNQVKFYVVIGPEFSFLLSGKEVKQGDAWEVVGETTGERDLKDYMNSFEFAGDLRLGVDIQVDPVVIFIDVGGSVGFTDILKETPPDIYLEEGSVVHLVPSASIGVLYQLGE